ncbi:hypothetical protein BU24DRAFT_415457 [Aaosphaeria arxii CBS 175.79]|uniref:Transcription factor domain-containing protein n=1 Tax=Aaosphaeria arxii CBS 175.79 TaxID=1450172 RepID=A0A6A5X837_9PLEO|nr:uncharacterized protein BU24DRAFT_415457 [Aaosphaeria arxii CBS 175.79]KAF2009113.1 hypothetical protein BU24DRAFT_415457 [Aaosphaeria arxii CBS 175.79]
MSKQFQFILAANDAKSKKENARVIRMAAMRTFRRNQRFSLVNEYTADRHKKHGCVCSQSPGSSNQTGEDSSDISLNSEADWSLGFRWRATLVDIGPIVAFDPFVSTTLQSTHEYIELFTRFVYTTSVVIQPLGKDVTKNPFSVIFARNALADPLILTAILYHTSVHYDRHSSATLIYYNETVRQLAQRLGNSDQIADDSTIAAAGLLAATGNITGDFRDTLVHWEALQRMVRIRGGLQALGWDGALAMILSVDLISSTITLSIPRLERPVQHLSNTDPFLLSFSKRSYFIDYTDMTTTLDYLVRSISELVFRYLESKGSLTSSTTSIICFTQILSTIEHCLLSIQLPSSNDPSPDVISIRIIQVARIAALISTSYYFRAFTQEAAFTVSLYKKFLEIVRDIEPICPTVRNALLLKLHLWSILVGCITSRNKELLESQVQHYMGLLNLADWKDLETFLEGYIVAPEYDASQ